ncbi:MAG TPA: efflux RND transporter periplasmic adaptor subunit [Ideonella sp.]|nr:efflux RND transporter periplasmic adaptor subunit [Ideonella sp.]
MTTPYAHPSAHAQGHAGPHPGLPDPDGGHDAPWLAGRRPEPPRRRWSPPLTVLAIAAAALAAGGWAIFAAPRASAAPASPTATALTVTVATAQRASWPSMLAATGAIAPWQEASIGAQTTGLRLTELRVDVGDVVRSGQLLARFDTDLLRADEAQLKASLAQAEASAAQARANRERALGLRGSGGLSEQDILQRVTEADTTLAQVAVVRAQLGAKQLQLSHAEVLAPDDGVISARPATLGAVAGSGQELMRLIRQGRLEWRGELDAAQLARVSLGQAVQLGLPDGGSATARVRQTAPTLDSGSRLGLVYAELEPGSRARAGMYASGQIALPPLAALVVPAASVVVRDGRSVVFKAAGTQATARITAQAVTVGRRQGAEVEIVQGLAEGEQVAVQGAGFLNDGDLVRVAPAAAATPAVLPGPAPAPRATTLAAKA